MLGRLFGTIDNIKATIVNKIKELIGSAFSWGSDMIRGFGDGIMHMLGDLKSKVTSVADGIRSKLHFSRPDERTITWLRNLDARYVKRYG